MREAEFKSIHGTFLLDPQKGLEITQSAIKGVWLVVDSVGPRKALCKGDFSEAFSFFQRSANN